MFDWKIVIWFSDMLNTHSFSESGAQWRVVTYEVIELVDSLHVFVIWPDSILSAPKD